MTGSSLASASVPQTVDELTAQLSKILGEIAGTRDSARRREREFLRAQEWLAEEKECLANLEATYADLRQQLIQACKRDSTR